jgi:hypothetical protein
MKVKIRTVMDINFTQILAIIIVIIVFGVVLTLINIKKKNKSVVNKEQTTWMKIEQLNTKKKELLEQKKEVSYKYSAKTVSEDQYSNTLKYINDEIKKIDDSINLEIGKLTKIQGNDETDDKFTNIKIKGEINEALTENKSLKEKVKELEDFIKNLSKNNSIETPNQDNAKLKYYELILNKHKEEINGVERKTISEIKDMVRPNDLTIKSMVSKYQPIGYDFNKDYINTLKQIYNYFKSEVDVIKNNLKVLFWIDFANIIKNKIADEQDISILLCSCMQALGDNNAKIEVVLLDDDKTHSFVKTKYKNTFYIFDLTQKVPFDMFKNIDENKLYEDYKFNGNKINTKIYSYNQYEYTNYKESE